MAAEDVKNVGEDVRRWLDAEFKIQDFPHKQVHWGYRVMAGDAPLLVAGLNNVDRIDVQGTVTVDGAFLERYRSLDAARQQAFRFAATERALSTALEVEFKDDENGGLDVEVKKILYAENLTRQDLVDAVRLVHHYIVGVRIEARRHLMG